MFCPPVRPTSSRPGGFAGRTLGYRLETVVYVRQSTCLSTVHTFATRGWVVGGKLGGLTYRFGAEAPATIERTCLDSQEVDGPRARARGGDGAGGAGVRLG